MPMSGAGPGTRVEATVQFTKALVEVGGYRVTIILQPRATKAAGLVVEFGDERQLA